MLVVTLLHVIASTLATRCGLIYRCVLRQNVPQSDSKPNQVWEKWILMVTNWILSYQVAKALMVCPVATQMLGCILSKLSFLNKHLKTLPCLIFLV